MIIGWPSDALMGSAKRRASVSPGPPAGAGTTMGIGRDGYVCACAIIGDTTTAPPSSVLKSRRFMSGMGTSSPMRYQPADRPVRSVFRYLSLPQRGRLVLGADLNLF